jgi:hypothetical protein
MFKMLEDFHERLAGGHFGMNITVIKYYLQVIGAHYA